MQRKVAVKVVEAQKKAKASKRGKNNQRKGKTFAKEVARLLAERAGVPEEELYSSMPGLTGGDITLSQRARERFPYSVEAKNCRQITMASWIAQATADAEGLGLPFLLIFKLHGRRRNYVTLELDELLKLIGDDVRPKAAAQGGG